QMQVFVRDLNDEELHPLAGAEGAETMFASGDGKSIGIRLPDGQIKGIPLGGGPITKIATAPGLSTPAWSEKNLVVVRQFGRPLSGVTGSGGELTPITALDTAAGERGHAMPVFLPGGEAIVFTIINAGVTIELATTTLDGKIKRLGIVG